MKLSNDLNDHHGIIGSELCCLQEGQEKLKYETTGGAFSLLFLSQHLEPRSQLKKDKYYILLGRNF